MKGMERRKNLRAMLRIGIPGFWLICFPLVAVFLWIFHEEFGTPIQYFQLSLLIGLGVPAVSFLVSYVAPREVGRVVIAHMVLGIFVFASLAGTVFFAFSFYFVGIHHPLLRTASLMAVVAVGIAWFWYSIAGLKRRMKERRFIEKEFRVCDTKIVMRTPPRTDLGPARIKDGSFLDKTGAWLFPKLVLLVPLGYPLQRLFSDAGGLSAVLLLMAVLALPLALYILGRMACGFYLWIYTIRKLERQHGKPVVFE